MSTAGLGIPPAEEIGNTMRAAESGVGARVFEVLPDVPALVLEYLPGRTLGIADVREPANIPRIAAACRRLHAGPRFVNDFSIFAKMHELLRLCHEHGLRIPDGYLDRLSTVEDVWAALAADPPPTVPCHNDLLAENFIDSGGEIRIVDYQLSGNNDPTFELGRHRRRVGFRPRPGRAARRGVLRRGAHAGAGRPGQAEPAAVQRDLDALVLGALRAATPPGRSRNDAADAESFDYWAEASDKWAQAIRDLDSPELGHLIDLVTGAHRTIRTNPQPSHP